MMAQPKAQKCLPWVLVVLACMWTVSADGVACEEDVCDEANPGFLSLWGYGSIRLHANPPIVGEETRVEVTLTNLCCNDADSVAIVLSVSDWGLGFGSGRWEEIGMQRVSVSSGTSSVVPFSHVFNSRGHFCLEARIVEVGRGGNTNSGDDRTQICLEVVYCDGDCKLSVPIVNSNDVPITIGGIEVGCRIEEQFIDDFDGFQVIRQPRLGPCPFDVRMQISGLSDDGTLVLSPQTEIQAEMSTGFSAMPAVADVYVQGVDVESGEINHVVLRLVPTNVLDMFNSPLFCCLEGVRTRVSLERTMAEALDAYSSGAAMLALKLLQQLIAKAAALQCDLDAERPCVERAVRILAAAAALLAQQVAPAGAPDMSRRLVPDSTHRFQDAWQTSDFMMRSGQYEAAMASLGRVLSNDNPPPPLPPPSLFDDTAAAQSEAIRLDASGVHFEVVDGPMLPAMLHGRQFAFDSGPGADGLGRKPDWKLHISGHANASEWNPSSTFLAHATRPSHIAVHGTFTFPPALSVHLMGRRVAKAGIPRCLYNATTDDLAAHQPPPSPIVDSANFASYAPSVRVRCLKPPFRYDEQGNPKLSPSSWLLFSAGLNKVVVAEGNPLDDARIVDADVSGTEFSLLLPVPSDDRDEAYTLIAAAGRVELRYRLTASEILRAVAAGQRRIAVDLTLSSSVVAELAASLDAEESNEEIATEHAAAIAEMEESVRAALLTRGFGRRTLRSMVRQQDPAASSRRLTPTSPACSSSSTNPICYSPGDEVVFNLMARAELVSYGPTTWSSNIWEVTFSSHPFRRLTTHYLSSGVVFQPTTGWTSGGVWRTPVLRERPAGFAVLRTRFGTSSPTAAYQAGVRILFTNSSIVSFGFELVNGANYNRPRKARKPFRVVMYDWSGSAIHEYRWYTSHLGNHFYGATMGTAWSGAIQWVEILLEEPGVMSIANLVYSTKNAATHFTSGSSDSLDNNVGWRSDGNWQKLSTAASAGYRHPWYGDSSRSTGGHSGGSYWNCPYGPGAPGQGSTLTSPAFTLSNLPLWDSKDDDPNNWFVGLALSAAVDHSTCSDYRIPSNIYSGCSCSSGSEWCCFLSKDMWTFSEASSTMHSHWSHAHFSSSADLDSAFISTNDPAGGTQRWVEYSTDNGKTWRNLFWWEDTNHRGSSHAWHQNHMHAFPDSDMTSDVYGTDFNGRPSVIGTDFDKDGTDDYTAPEDWNQDGTVNASDVREWDTEFYLRWRANPASTGTVSTTYLGGTTLNGTGYNFVVSDLEAPSVSYRFRFVGNSTPTSCPGTCAGWSVDDVALSNDDPDQGYFTNFDGSYDSTLK